MKKNSRNYTVRKRKDCNRYELIVRGGKGWPSFSKLYLTEKEALEAFQKNWADRKPIIA